MGRLKQFLFDQWEDQLRDGYVNPASPVNPVNPVFHDALNNMQTQPRRDAKRIRAENNTNQDIKKVSKVYGMFINGELTYVYLHKDAADFDCWLCEKYEHNSDEPIHYKVKPLPFNALSYDDLQSTTTE